MNDLPQPLPHPKLGVNIDHVATLREARYRMDRLSPNAEPSPVEAALAAERAGAHGITAHLRLDRRHIQDADIHELRARVATKLNLEMGISEEILALALDIRPDDACLVPENRQEVTTEGGLDCVRGFAQVEKTVRALQAEGIRVSLFIDPEPAQVEAAASLRADCIELHTGAYANARGEDAQRELERLRAAAAQALSLGLLVNAGHGLNYHNTGPVARIPGLHELNIGHSIVSRAVFTGMEQAVRDMLALLRGERI